MPHGECSWALLLPQLASLLSLPLAPEGVNTAATQIILSGHLLYRIVCSSFSVLGGTSQLAKVTLTACTLVSKILREEIANPPELSL